MQWIEFLIERGSFFKVIISSNYERQEAFFYERKSNQPVRKKKEMISTQLFLETLRSIKE